MSVKLVMRSDGTTLVPEGVREYLDLNEGDYLTWSINATGDVTLRKATEEDLEYARARCPTPSLHSRPS